MFIDIVQISLAAGHGGAGLVSFRREKFYPKGGPDGGNGGRGGDIVLRGNQHMNTLLDFRYKQRYEAENGKPGQDSNKTGRSGKPLIVQVPVGTLVKDAVTGEILADVTEHNQDIVLLRGGIGGRGNAEFATSTNQTPRHAEGGRPGEEVEVVFELKLLADVGLVGFPNAGKSTLISVLSAAKPKIADYPFTTLVPNLGMVYVGPEQSYCVADIPGLIEGASEGKGLGFQFLRHVERTRVLVFMLDPTNIMSVKDQLKILRKELTTFNPELKKKQSIICLTKIDSFLPEDIELILKDLKRSARGKVYPISSVSQENISDLSRLLYTMVLEDRKNEEIENLK